MLTAFASVQGIPGGAMYALREGLNALYRMTYMECMSPECARRVDKLSRGLCLALSAHWIIPSEPELQYITCDRWQLSHQGACQQTCKACVCPEGHTRGDLAILSYERCHTWCKNHAVRNDCHCMRCCQAVTE